MGRIIAACVALVALVGIVETLLVMDDKRPADEPTEPQETQVEPAESLPVRIVFDSVTGEPWAVIDLDGMEGWN